MELKDLVKRRYKRVIQLEFNEISSQIVDQLITRGELPNFAKARKSWTIRQTSSEQEYQHLEPWIQWITAHTGKSFAEHQIFHLSDVDKLVHPQIWEALSERGCRSAIVGSMNAKRGSTKEGFFFPDPWSRGGKTYPPQIQPLWDLITKKVHSHATGSIRLADLWQGFNICRQFKLPLSLYVSIAKQLLRQKMSSKQRWRLAGIFDVFLAEIFKSILKSTDFAYYTLFLNAVAHYQHHYWRHFEKSLFNQDVVTPDCLPNDDPVTYGYRLYDRILGNILEAVDTSDTLVVIVSALSQVPYVEKEHEGGMNYYRLRNHANFATLLGIAGVRVLPMMSRDWQIESSDAKQLQHAKQRLKCLRVNNQPLFRIDQKRDDSLFIETAFTQGVNSATVICNEQGKTVARFYDCFVNIAVKSGHHIGKGMLWLSELPSKEVEKRDQTDIPLTALYPLTLDALQPEDVAC